VRARVRREKQRVCERERGRGCGGGGGESEREREREREMIRNKPSTIRRRLVTIRCRKPPPYSGAADHSRCVCVCVLCLCCMCVCSGGVAELESKARKRGLRVTYLAPPENNPVPDTLLIAITLN